MEKLANAIIFAIGIGVAGGALWAAALLVDKLICAMPF